MINYDKILQQLTPYKDIVFYYGLTEDAILEIEQKIHTRFPSYFREFLKIFGVRQDWVFELITDENTFIKRTAYLPQQIRDLYVLVGENGGEDFWLLNARDERDTDIYEWYDGEITNLGFNFESLLERNIFKLSNKETSRESNESKSWCVQFSIPTNNEPKIYSTIPLKIIREWELREITPAKVYCYETTAKLVDKTISFRKSEFSGWSSPSYYFDLKEPVSQFGQYSLIKEIDAKLKEAFPKYKLIDYGILPLLDED